MRNCLYSNVLLFMPISRSCSLRKVPRQRSRAGDGEPGFAHEVAFVDLTTARAVTQAGQQAAAGGKEGAAFTSDSADAKQPRSGSSFLCPSVSAADKAGELPVTLNGEMTCAALTPGSAPSSQAYGDVAHAEEESLKHKHTMMECCKESYRQGEYSLVAEEILNFRE